MDERPAYRRANRVCELTALLDRLDPPGWGEVKRAWKGHPEAGTLHVHHLFGRKFDGCHLRYNLIRAAAPAHEFVQSTRGGRLVGVWVKLTKGEFGPKEAEYARIGKGKDQLGDLSNDYRADLFKPAPALVDLAERVLTLTGRLCPYCHHDSEVVPYAEFDDRFPGKWVWVCRPCDARVGCAKETRQALGSLADYATRLARREAHAAFDPLWGEDGEKRSELYRRLSAAMGLPLGLTHIGMFDADQCRRVVTLCESGRIGFGSGPVPIGEDVTC